MPEDHLTEVSARLKEVMRPSALRKLGENSGFVLRQRVITAERVVPSLIKALASFRIDSIANLARDFNFDHGEAVHYKPYYQKLNTPCFPRMMKGLLETMLAKLYLPVLEPLRGGPFARFQEILIHDGTSFA